MKDESVQYILEIIQTLKEHEFTDYFDFMSSDCPLDVSEKLENEAFHDDLEFISVFKALLDEDKNFPPETYKENVIEFLEHRISPYVN